MEWRLKTYRLPLRIGIPKNETKKKKKPLGEGEILSKNPPKIIRTGISWNTWLPGYCCSSVVGHITGVSQTQARCESWPMPKESGFFIIYSERSKYIQTVNSWWPINWSPQLRNGTNTLWGNAQNDWSLGKMKDWNGQGYCIENVLNVKEFPTQVEV